MSRKSSNRSRPQSVRRDASRIANSATYYRSQPELPFSIPLTPIEDRRTFHPHGETRSARSFRQRVASIIAHPTSPSMLAQSPRAVSHAVQFETPSDVLVCVRRHRRREVLHALRKTGRVGQKRPKRNLYSDVRC